jgi:uncharacterized protein YjiS (DUF1127 family)
MTTIFPATRSRPWRGRLRWLATWPNRVLAYWQRRETIKMLRSLNDHQLRDIGIRRDHIEAAANGVAESVLHGFHGRGQR